MTTSNPNGRPPTLRRAILDALAHGWPMSVADIADEVERSVSATRSVLSKMRARGLVRNVRRGSGLWAIEKREVEQ